MALVITLAIVVLLAFVLVALLSRATSNLMIENTNSGGVEAGLLAKSAANLVVSDLQAEIKAGSVVTTTNGVTLYDPSEKRNMLPSRQLLAGVATNNTNFVNLVKQSGKPMFAGSPTLSVTGSEPTTTLSANKRSVSADRWSAPMLTGDTLPNTPNWIYVNRNAGMTSTVATDTIGRFAYNVYDVGGLLDINVAGFSPDRSGAADPLEMTSKGDSVWADLRALPGINTAAYAATDAWPPQWRVTGDWSTFTSDAATSSLPWYRRTGWLQPYLNAGGAASDRMFTSRQDLIRFAKANPNTFTVDAKGRYPALQYLTTFSRDLEQPNYQPESGRPKVSAGLGAGGNDAYGSDDQINPPVGKLYVGDQPVLKKRFPLSRLSLVGTPVPPSAPVGSAADILKHFGLTWSSSDNCWIYKADSIPRLRDVNGREPDFFEVLKGAISVGSLGKQFGFNFPSLYVGISFNGQPFPPSRIGGDDGHIDDHIIQIGANIIDQADRDSFPTRIKFNGKLFFGIENLPRLYRARHYAFRLGTIPSFGYRSTDASPVIQPAQLFVNMVTPELWNPHQAGTGTSAAPTDFRVVATSVTPVGGEAFLFWDGSGNPLGGFFSNYSSRPNGPDCSRRIDYSPSNAAITFSVGTGAASFREPQPLMAVGYPVGSNANGIDTTDMTVTSSGAPGNPDNVVTLPQNVVPPMLATGSYRKALGFVTSYVPYVRNTLGNPPPKYNPAFNQDFYWFTSMKGTGGPLIMELQYFANGSWYTMDKMNVTYDNDHRITDLQTIIAGREDPRTERWGSIYFKRGQSVTSNDSMLGYPQWRTAAANEAYDNHGSPPDAGTWCYPLAPGWTYGAGRLSLIQLNSKTGATRYADPDGVVRGGDATYDTGMARIPSYLGESTARPVILNRPFRSVAELGNVFRDVPWKSLDFMTSESGDRALLDVFAVSESPDDSVIAGRVNLNTRQIPVIAALMQNAGLASGAHLSAADAAAAATKLVEFTQSEDTGKGPLQDRSQVVGRFVSGNTFIGPIKDMGDAATVGQPTFKASREALVRATADAGTTRSWTMLIDVIAQSGVRTPTGGFAVNGEQRLWLTVAIDRFTNKIIGLSSEIVSE